MIISVTGIGDIFIPPYALGVDSLVGEGVALNNRPARERAELEVAVLDLVLRGSGSVVLIVGNLGEEYSLNLRVSVFADSDVVNGYVAVVGVIVVINYSDIDFLILIIGKVEIILVEVVGIIYACGVSFGDNVILGVLVEELVGLHRYHLVVLGKIEADEADFFLRLKRRVRVFAYCKRAARNLQADNAVTRDCEYSRADSARSCIGVLAVIALSRKVPVARVINGQEVVVGVVIKGECLSRTNAVIVKGISVLNRPAREVGGFKSAVQNRVHLLGLGFRRGLVLVLAGGQAE